MIEQVSGDKVRFIDKFHGEHFVHSLEIGPDFLTFFVLSSFDDRTLQAMIDKDADMTKHDAEKFHADDPKCAWVWDHFGYTETPHFHMRFPTRPCADEVNAVLACLGGGAGPGLRKDIDTYFSGGAHASGNG